MRAILAALLLAALPLDDDMQSRTAPAFVVIVNADNSVATIDRELLSKIFLKRLMKWPNGLAAQPVDLAIGAAPRVAFTAEVHKKSVGAVRAFWQQQIFSGREVPPPEKSSENDVAAFVKENPGAVGYLSASTPLPDGVKAIAVK
jgi:ABC-type phosphate transport system substrate-binding protein